MTSAADTRVPLPAGLGPVWIVMRRELRDTLRDWRIVVPILLLTLAFPLLMNFTAQYLRNFLQEYGQVNTLIGDRLVPFLLMIVGFFPISFSLVIALETFVGEKERKSLEALLATPLSDGQLYLGKMLGAMLPPLVASYIGMAFYLLGVYGSIHWSGSLELLVLIFVLTTLQATVMVCGAVVVSSQVTSVRASNLLASFIIIPMALLIQVDSVLMFWNDLRPLWYVALALAVVTAILVRMGVHLFNREELLGRELDEFNPRRLWGQIVNGWFEGVPAGRRRSLPAWYRYSVAASLRRVRTAAAVVVLAVLLAFGIGWYYSSVFPLPAALLGQLPGQMNRLPETMELYVGGPAGFLMQNLRVLVAAALLGTFSFGTMAIVLVMAPFAIFGYITGQFALAGYSPVLFLAAFLLPHGIAETPAAVLAGAAALRLGATVIAPPPGRTLGEVWLQALTDLVKVFVAVTLPLLVVAALLEFYVTPRVAMLVFGAP